jgi:hypothetical protein
MTTSLPTRPVRSTRPTPDLVLGGDRSRGQAPRESAGPGGLAQALSLLLAVVAMVSCALTVFVPDLLTGPAVMTGSARGTALVALVVAVPVQLAALVQLRRGSVRALPVWLGAVAFLLYNAVLFLFATPFDPLFLLRVALLGLALWTLVVALAGIDVPAWGARFTRPVPARAVAGYVFVVVALNALAWLVPVLRAIVESGPPAFLAGTGMTTHPLYVQDLAFWLPAMAVGAVLLLRRAAWGALVVTAGLAFWVVESVSVAVDQWMGHAADPASSVASAAATVPFGVLALVGLVPLLAMLRGLPALPPTTDPARRRGWAWSLVALQVLVAGMAGWGGTRMVVDGFGMPEDWLHGSGFVSWALPGLALLLGVAVPQLLAAGLVAVEHPWSVPVAWVAGVSLVGWIVVQLAVLQRYFFLQPVVAIVGLAEIALLLAWQRGARVPA